MPRNSLLNACALVGAALLATAAAIACGSFSGSDAPSQPQGDGGARDGALLGPDGDILGVGGGDDGGAEGGLLHCTHLAPFVCDDFDTTNTIATFWTNRGSLVKVDHLNAASPTTAVVAASDVEAGQREVVLGVAITAPKGVYAVDFDFKTTLLDPNGCTIFRLYEQGAAIASLVISPDRVTLSHGNATTAFSATTAGIATSWAHVHLDADFRPDGGIGATIHGETIPYLEADPTSPTPDAAAAVPQIGVIASAGDCGVYFDNVVIKYQ